MLHHEPSNINTWKLVNITPKNVVDPLLDNIYSAIDALFYRGEFPHRLFLNPLSLSLSPFFFVSIYLSKFNKQEFSITFADDYNSILISIIHFLFLFSFFSSSFCFCFCFFHHVFCFLLSLSDFLFIYFFFHLCDLIYSPSFCLYISFSELTLT